MVHGITDQNRSRSRSLLRLRFRRVMFWGVIGMAVVSQGCARQYYYYGGLPPRSGGPVVTDGYGYGYGPGSVCEVPTEVNGGVIVAREPRLNPSTVVPETGGMPATAPALPGSKSNANSNSKRGAVIESEPATSSPPPLRSSQRDADADANDRTALDDRVGRRQGWRRVEDGNAIRTQVEGGRETGPSATPDSVNALRDRRVNRVADESARDGSRDRDREDPLPPADPE